MTKEQYKAVHRRARLGDLCALSATLWPKMYDHALGIYDDRIDMTRHNVRVCDPLDSEESPSLWLSHGRWRFAGQVPRVAFPRRLIP